MKVSIDLGGSTVDVIIFGKNNEIKKIKSFESNQIDRKNLLLILEKSDLKLRDIQDLRVTGGFSLHLTNRLNELKIQKIPEFDANGFGGCFLANLESALIISLGTGTSMVKVEKGQMQHIGGTGVGGGTLLGLGKLLLNQNNYATIDALAQKGNLNQVDLSVEEIVGSGIGMIPGNATASNFGKIGIKTPSDCHAKPIKIDKVKKTDLALGICNLIGETVGGIAYFASEKYKLNKIILIGKVLRVNNILQIIQTTSKLYNKEVIVPDLAEFGTAIGAGVYPIKNL